VRITPPEAPSRERAAIISALDRSVSEQRPWVVHVGAVRGGKRPARLFVCTADEPRPRGAELVAWCSPTGLVRVLGSWAGRIVFPAVLDGTKEAPNVDHSPRAAVEGR